ncbi:hypothetical protein [Paraclostridium bifermentans]|uniref:hypothetical protein n=1 Tax=Paraclostridium bifermentans TaxID=1490 RepID=UPI0018D070CF|nr:hypothetical protein [Paraclostridium bifermentans]
MNLLESLENAKSKKLKPNDPLKDITKIFGISNLLKIIDNTNKIKKLNKKNLEKPIILFLDSVLFKFFICKIAIIIT